MEVGLASRLQEFGAEPEAALRAAELLSPPAMIAPGVAIARGGQPATHLRLLVEGWAHHRRDLRDGRRQIVALVLSGELCDLEVLASAEGQACITTLSPCWVARLPLAPLRVLTDEHPSLQVALARMTARNRRIATEWMVSLGRRSAMERIAHLLCEIAVRLAGPPRSDTVQFPLLTTQLDLADAAGLSVVHVNRSLQTLKRQVGLVLERRRATIPSWAAMVAAAEFDPGYLEAKRGDLPRAEPLVADRRAAVARG